MIQKDFVEAMHKKLLQQREECESRISELESNDPFNLNVRSGSDEDRTSPDDEAQLNEQHERVITQIDAQKKMIVRIDFAIERIHNGTYGVCEVCGNPIEESRLTAMPFAALCLSDEKTSEKRIKSKI